MAEDAIQRYQGAPHRALTVGSDNERQHRCKDLLLGSGAEIVQLCPAEGHVPRLIQVVFPQGHPMGALAADRLTGHCLLQQQVLLLDLALHQPCVGVQWYPSSKQDLQSGLVLGLRSHLRDRLHLGEEHLQFKCRQFGRPGTLAGRVRLLNKLPYSKRLQLFFAPRSLLLLRSFQSRPVNCSHHLRTRQTTRRQQLWLT